MKFLGLEVLLRGNSTQLNPDLPLDEQTELLPYDARWEFPRHRLTFGTYDSTRQFCGILYNILACLQGNSWESVLSAELLRP